MARIFDNIDQDLLSALRATMQVSKRSDFCVGYLNLRPFRESDNMWLENINIGGSVSLGSQVYVSAPLPLRTSLQSSPRMLASAR